MKQKILNLFLGEFNKYSLQHRIFNGFSLIGFFLSITSTIGNYVLNLPLIVSAITFFMTVMFMLFYYLARVKNIYDITSKITVFILVFLFSPSIWITNGGSYGGSQYYLIFFGLVISSLTFGTERKFYIFSLIIILMSLIVFEYYYPEKIIGYIDRDSRYIDVFMSIVFSTVGTWGLFTIFTNNYFQEHQKVVEYSKKMEELAIKDGLTDLFNHRYILNRLDDEIVKSFRYGRDLSIAMVDIDFFKKVNDNYGHQFGDIVLRKVADEIKNTLRNTDLVGRYGGEEFLIIAPETTLEQAKIFCERIRKTIEEIEFEDNIKVTVSLGLATWKDCSLNEFIEKADKNLYCAKQTGRNKVVF